MNSGNSRIYLLLILFFIVGAAIIGRLFYIQITNHSHYKALASKQHINEEVLPAKRGEIFFSDEVNILAENRGMETINIAPREIEDPIKLAKTLAPIVEMEESEILKKISFKDDPWIVLKKDVTLEKTEGLREIKGVYLESNFSRYYPQNKMASHLIGFYGYDQKGEKRVGQYGIEGYWNTQLQGEDGYWKGMVDANGNRILSPFNEIQEPINGDHLILTLDSNIQVFIEEQLEDLIKKYKPAGGTIIVSNPQTGEILAMASRPNFDPNNYRDEKDISVFKNPAVSIPFEPGSIFKPITMAGALEENIVSPQTTYIDKGKVKISGCTIRNSDLKAHGKKTMTEVLELSLNTGAVFVVEQLGREKFIKYVEDFGFGENTSIDLSSEVSGSINNILNPPSNEKLIEYANASFGQGISATPIQIITAFSAIANQGKMVKPYVVKKIIHPNGNEEEIKQQAIKEVMSPETASRLTAMMVSVVKNGYGKKAGVEGYLIAGKTGTAQVPDLDKGGYFPNKTIHSFIGYAPAFNPKFLIFLKMDYPKGVRFSSDSLTPAFNKIAQYLFSYLGIPPGK
jgi:cell division protein FtsI/penicillin-binding protein 2